MNTISVFPLSGTDIDGCDYDVAVAACGFESRCRFFFETKAIKAQRKVATDYGHRHGVAHATNRSWFEGASFELESESDIEFANRFLAVSYDAACKSEVVKCVIDISGFTRARLAALLEAVWHQDRCVFDIDWVYSIAAYYDPPEDIAIDEVGPASPLFAGWTDAPDLPTATVFGLGFEPRKVLGTIEFLESEDVYACIPDGPDPRFMESVVTANEEVLRSLKEHRTFNYRVAHPFDTFVWVESMCAGLLCQARLVLIPFGPKVFALICMLAALVHLPKVMVLRVSGVGRSDRDVEAAGDIYMIRCRVSPETQSGGG